MSDEPQPGSGPLPGERMESMIRALKTSLTAAALVFAAVSLSACEEDEQDRILRYDKGTYLGPEDQPLEEETLDELRSRTRNQEGA